MSYSEPPPFLYRTFHDRCAGRNSRYGFEAGQPDGPYDPNQRRALYKHFNLNNREPTRWISTTSDLLRAIKLARSYEIQEKKRIFIAVIGVEACQYRPVSAEKKSHEYGITNPHLRKTEFLFLSRIPERAIVSCLSWENLINSGLDEIVPELDPDCYDPNIYEQLELADLRLMIKNSKEGWGRQKFWRVGETAANVAECFGIGAHTEHICITVMKDWWDVEYWPKGETGRAIKMFKEDWDFCTDKGNGGRAAPRWRDEYTGAEEIYPNVRVRVYVT